MFWELATAKKIFKFHGAYKSKRAAVKQEKRTPRSFIEKFGYSGGSRYAVVTRKGKR